MECPTSTTPQFCAGSRIGEVLKCLGQLAGVVVYGLSGGVVGEDRWDVCRGTHHGVVGGSLVLVAAEAVDEDRDSAGLADLGRSVQPQRWGQWWGELITESRPESGQPGAC